MEFYLTYKGALKANACPKEKHEIRKHFKPQLKKVWDMEPLKRYKECLSEKQEPGRISMIKEIGNIRFAPLITSKSDLVCELDIVLLWPDEAGKIIDNTGDIDNRLKTLFDALACPDKNQIEKVLECYEKGDPFFVLLEDDKLITSVSIKTGTLLSSQDNSDVFMIIEVKVKAVTLNYANMCLPL